MSIVKSYSFPEGDIRGDMFYIKHGSNNFTVIDCYLKDNDGENARKTEIIDEINRESEGRICRFISTHPDNDHIAGIESLDDNWKILNFYAVENSHPSDINDSSLTRYQLLLANNNCAIKRGLTRKWLNDSDKNSPNDNGSSGIYFHWPDLENEKFKAALELVAKAKHVNNICPIFTYCIENGAKYMWMGDLETEMQQAYYDEYKSNIPHVDILFQPHHGRKSGAVPTKLLDALNPQLIIIGNAPSEHIDYGDSRQTITQNIAGDLYFVNESNEVHIYTKNMISNKPNCLKQKQGKGDLTKKVNGKIVVDWHYIGTLTANTL